MKEIIEVQIGEKRIFANTVARNATSVDVRELFFGQHLHSRHQKEN